MMCDGPNKAFFVDKLLNVVLMMEVVHTSETSVRFNMTTRRYIPEDSKLHTRRLENLKFHNFQILYSVKL
jgi:hypothetical protein